MREGGVGRRRALVACGDDVGSLRAASVESGQRLRTVATFSTVLAMRNVFRTLDILGDTCLTCA